MGFYIWDSYKWDSQLQIIESRVLETEIVENFLKEYFDQGKIVAVSSHIKFIDDSVLYSLGDMISPKHLYNLMQSGNTEAFVKSHYGCIRECLEQWSAQRVDFTPDGRYMILIKGLLPKDNAKQEEMFK